MTGLSYAKRLKKADERRREIPRRMFNGRAVCPFPNPLHLSSAEITSTETKKDPGIPSEFPYKDQILAEVAEQRRLVSFISEHKGDNVNIIHFLRQQRRKKRRSSRSNVLYVWPGNPL